MKELIEKSVAEFREKFESMHEPEETESYVAFLTHSLEQMYGKGRESVVGDIEGMLESYERSSRPMSKDFLDGVSLAKNIIKNTLQAPKE